MVQILKCHLVYNIYLALNTFPPSFTSVQAKIQRYVSRKTNKLFEKKSAVIWEIFLQSEPLNMRVKIGFKSFKNFDRYGPKKNHWTDERMDNTKTVSLRLW